MTNAAVNGPIGRMLVLGGGYCGRRFAEALADRAVPVLLTRRSTSGSGTLPTLRFDGSAGVVPEAEALGDITHVLVTIPPDEQGQDPALTLLGPLLRRLPLQWVGYLSTSGVYGDRGGAWVQESDNPRPVLPRSRARLACESAWRQSGLPVQVFRLPAIYGPGRSPFASLRGGRSRLIHKPGQVFSRVHVDDIVGGLLHCLALPAERRPVLLNLADDCPCPSSETLGYAAHLIGCRLPDVEPFARIASSLSPMARSFWSENRRTGNRRLCRELGYRLRHRTYREGFRACLLEEEASGANPDQGPAD